MSQAIMGIVSDLVRADHLVKRLFAAGFGSGMISVLGPDSPVSHIRCEKHSKAPEGALLGATVGAGLGAALGLLAKAGLFNFPAADSLIAAGPELFLLCAAAVCALAGMLIGGMIGLCIPEYEVKQFAGLLSGGNILVSVHIESKEQLKLVTDLFESARAEDINCVEEDSSPL